MLWSVDIGICYWLDDSNFRRIDEDQYENDLPFSKVGQSRIKVSGNKGTLSQNLYDNWCFSKKVILNSFIYQGEASISLYVIHLCLKKS